MSSLQQEGKARILIIDDNRAIHADFRKMLGGERKSLRHLEQAEAALFGGGPGRPSPSAASFQIDSAFQGEDGLGLVEQALKEGQPYRVAFVDVRMPPGWDGVETTARIWAVDPNLQIVICTAYSDYSWDEMLKQLGHSDQLVILKKPFEGIEAVQLATSLSKKWQLLLDSEDKLLNLERMVARRTSQLVEERAKFKGIFDSLPEGIFQTTREGGYLSANPALASIYGYGSPEELMTHLRNVDVQLYVAPGRRAEFRRLIEQAGEVREFESEVHCKDGTKKWISETARQITAADGTLLYYQGFVVDITRQRNAQCERNLMEAQLRQAQKLESVGQLAAGIAHEINTPIQYIGDNIRFVQEAFADLIRLLDAQQRLTEALRADALTPGLLAEAESAAKETDFAYLKEEVPKAIKQSLDGVGHVAHIVCAMKEFSHPGNTEKVRIDLNKAIQTTLTVARNEWKYVAGVVTEFAADLPLVACLPSEFNQVILNLVVNAAHAIGEVVARRKGALGEIRIATKRKGDWVEIRISDTGTGIPEEIQHRIFEPFFTTKEVGKGTGQGLAIARSTIVSKHGGELTFESAMGRGTTFLIRLPLNETPANKTETKP